MQQGDGRPSYRSRLRRDQGFWIELAICQAAGIPHSQFLSWSPEDRSKAVAFELEKAARCDLCGTAEWEWEENREAYAPVEKLCMGCYLKEAAQDDSGTMQGTSIVLVPTSSLEYEQNLDRQAKRWAAQED